jgi:hypothetical protein
MFRFAAKLFHFAQNDPRISGTDERSVTGARAEIGRSCGARRLVGRMAALLCRVRKRD